jgi:regulation of enolase protein 1 (concanavalin A-like superfamily)
LIMKHFLHGKLVLLPLLVLMILPNATKAFEHPGIPLTVADLNTVKSNLNIAPWSSGYAALVGDFRSSTNYTMQGPFGYVNRNLAGNYDNETAWKNDMQAIFNLARMWYFTSNSAYAQKAHDILIAWANTQTNFGGIEANLDLGDYAYRFGGGADILRGTWPGWTAADTASVSNLFEKVYWPAALPDGDALGPANKGTLSMAGAMACAVFNDDTNKFNRVLNLFRTSASAGIPNTLPTGEHGESGRDQGHAYGMYNGLAFVAEVLWKQGVDVYSDSDNRLLALGEYHARNNLALPAPYIVFGTTDFLYWVNATNTAQSYPWPHGRMGLNLLRNAYVLRKGLTAPYLELKRATQPVDMDNFTYERTVDASTAAPPSPQLFPSVASATNGLTNLDIGGATPVGSGTSSNGIWTVKGGGAEIYTHSADSFHYVYKAVTGDCAIIAQVTSVENTHATAKAAVMIRDSLSSTAANRAWIGITPSQTAEFYMHGWTQLRGGSNWEKGSRSLPEFPYWVKLERLGSMINLYTSLDGTSWACVGAGAFGNMGSNAYIGLAVCSLANGTLNTSTFSDVRVTGGNGGEPAHVPAAPYALLGSPGDGSVPLRWLESFGATGYNVKRAVTSGGPYITIASVAGTSFVDTSVVNGTNYFYVATATNTAGESVVSPEESVTPLVTMINVATNGTATASANGSSSTEGAAKAFDKSSGTKWFNGNAGTTGWIQYDLGTGVSRVVKGYDVITGNDVPGRDPRNWQFQGSANGSVWTTLDNQTNEDFAAYLQFPQRYFITNTTAYRFYRLNITTNNGDATGIQLSELTLLMPVITPPPIPTGLNATAGDATVTLNWNPANNATGYNVKRSTTNGGSYSTAFSTSLTNGTNSGLANGTLYYFVVTATNSSGESLNSAQVSVRPVSMTPTNIATTLNGGQLQLIWPQDHTGWTLQTQTNSSSVGLGTNWFIVSGSVATNQISVPFDASNVSVFFRLAYP